MNFLHPENKNNILHMLYVLRNMHVSNNINKAHKCFNPRTIFTVKCLSLFIALNNSKLQLFLVFADIIKFHHHFDCTFGTLIAFWYLDNKWFLLPVILIGYLIGKPIFCPIRRNEFAYLLQTRPCCMHENECKKGWNG